MSTLSRDFTKAEKAMLVVFALILVALAYYFVVDQPVRIGVAAANGERDALRIELRSLQTRLEQLEQMRAEIERLGSLDSVSRMGSYNNRKAELAELNNILEAAESYAISFTKVDRRGEQIRRNISLQFSAEDYATIKKIIVGLENCKNRCLIGDIRYSDEVRYEPAARRGEAPVERRVIRVDTTATFFETMYDGTPDAGLPEERAGG